MESHSQSKLKHTEHSSLFFSENDFTVPCLDFALGLRTARVKRLCGYGSAAQGFGVWGFTVKYFNISLMIFAWLK